VRSFAACEELSNVDRSRMAYVGHRFPVRRFDVDHARDQCAMLTVNMVISRGRRRQVGIPRIPSLIPVVTRVPSRQTRGALPALSNALTGPERADIVARLVGRFPNPGGLSCVSP